MAIRTKNVRLKKKRGGEKRNKTAKSKQIVTRPGVALAACIHVPCADSVDNGSLRRREMASRLVSILEEAAIIIIISSSIQQEGQDVTSRYPAGGTAGPMFGYSLPSRSKVGLGERIRSLDSRVKEGHVLRPVTRCRCCI